MKRSSLVAFASLSVCLCLARANEATAPVDYTQRNERFAPAAMQKPSATSPRISSTVQEKRFEKTITEKTKSGQFNHRAPIDLTEASPKIVIEKKLSRPEIVESRHNAWDHREASISVSSSMAKPPLVKKYQASLSAASAANPARLPAGSAAAQAKINRFVYRKNAPQSESDAASVPVVRAGGDEGGAGMRSAPAPKK